MIAIAFGETVAIAFGETVAIAFGETVAIAFGETVAVAFAPPQNGGTGGETIAWRGQVVLPIAAAPRRWGWLLLRTKGSGASP
jgi:hypothetical protein